MFQLCDMTDTDLQFLYKLGQECTQDAVRANAIRIVSIVGRVLAKQTTPHPLLKVCGVCVRHNAVLLMKIFEQTSDVIGIKLDANLYAHTIVTCMCYVCSVFGHPKCCTTR